MEQPITGISSAHPTLTSGVTQNKIDLQQRIDEQLKQASIIEEQNPNATYLEIDVDPRKEARLIYTSLGEEAGRLVFKDKDAAQQIDTALLEKGIEYQLKGDTVVASQIFRAVNSTGGYMFRNPEATDRCNTVNLNSCKGILNTVKNAAGHPERKWAKFQYAVMCFEGKAKPEDNNKLTGMKYLTEAANLGCEGAKNYMAFKDPGHFFNDADIEALQKEDCSVYPSEFQAFLAQKDFSAAQILMKKYDDAIFKSFYNQERVLAMNKYQAAVEKNGHEGAKLALLKLKAEDGDIGALYELGKCEVEGTLGATQNVGAGKKKIGQAAEKGHVPAVYDVAEHCYLNGDKETAMNLYKIAAEARYKDAVQKLIKVQLELKAYNGLSGFD